MEALMEFPWPGNELQLETFCERMLLTTMKKTIAGDFVHFLLNELYPQTKVNRRTEKQLFISILRLLNCRPFWKNTEETEAQWQKRWESVQQHCGDV